MKIKKLHLKTSHLESLKAFYIQKLGFELLEESKKSFVLKAGNSLLEFEQTEEHTKDEAFYHFAFNIPQNQLEEARKWLKGKEIALLPFNNLEIIDFPNWNAHSLYLMDSGGNIAEFIARHDLANASEEIFTAQSITEISEIGLPVHSIEPFYQKLEKEMNIPVYSHISNMTSFCAAGDIFGLFIIVALTRAWFPTEIVNAVFPCKIIIESAKVHRLDFEGLPYQIESVLADS